ncbi:SDR family oxidoreductase [Inmirania thermothiophila]|uniref:Citronellol/citronellal dehydrogenase n=1 Tax=Inmirania thermothiophila TaxID=1750597 RepID=A0A3N1Y8Q9_9GAMM|nr:NAD(P)-dependent oxidoreductase [Inmirania thermothiophila]ROR35196.1 citronellol/citronellal dehydrogenase [Inmirania thermothiophila]
MSETFAGRTVFITGASRGIGRAIALRLAREGARIVVTGKTDAPHPRLEGTIHEVAEAVRAAGGEALAIRLDVRDAEAVAAAVAQAAETFGGIDALVNNASAIHLAGTEATPAKRFDLMMAVNVRATFLCSQACIPHLRRAANPHILNLAPPLNMDPRWFRDHVAYTISKYGMSMCTLGMAAELAADGIAVNSLWPATTIATAAIEVHFPPEVLRRSRRPEIVAEAARAILARPSRAFTGRFCIDEEVLREEGVSDFSAWAVDPTAPPQRDLFLD